MYLCIIISKYYVVARVRWIHRLPILNRLARFLLCDLFSTPLHLTQTRFHSPGALARTLRGSSLRHYRAIRILSSHQFSRASFGCAAMRLGDGGEAGHERASSRARPPRRRPLSAPCTCRRPPPNTSGICCTGQLSLSSCQTHGVALAVTIRQSPVAPIVNREVLAQNGPLELLSKRSSS